MRATRLPPMRNTTGPHRARHSVFRHPATMPDKAGVEVYRYARRPVDSLVCVGPIRGTGNASMRSCCALYGYVSGSHAVHARRRKSGPFPCCDYPGNTDRRPARGIPPWDVERDPAASARLGPSCDSASRAAASAACESTITAIDRRKCRAHSPASVPAHDSLRPHPSRGARYGRKVRSMAESMSSAAYPSRFRRAPPATRRHPACL